MDKKFPIQLTVVPEEASFQPEVDPVAQEVVAGVVAVYHVRATAIGGEYDGILSLSVAGLPEGAWATFSSDTMVVGDDVTLEIATEGVAAGVYDMTVDYIEVV